MSVLDDILQSKGLKYEDLTIAEHDTLNSWMAALQEKTISVEKIKEYIGTMRDAVATELINEPEFTYIFLFRVPNRKQILLKARLCVYILLEGYLTSPERAKKAIERTLEGIKGGK